MPAPAMRIRYHQKPISRPPYLTDIDNLNAIAVAARIVCLHPDKYRIAYLRQVLEDVDRGGEALVKSQEAPDGDPMVTVCSECLRASCWRGEFYCDEYKTAGTVDKTVAELKKLNLENPSYWTEEVPNEQA